MFVQIEFTSQVKKDWKKKKKNSSLIYTRKYCIESNLVQPLHSATSCKAIWVRERNFLSLDLMVLHYAAPCNCRRYISLEKYYLMAFIYLFYLLILQLLKLMYHVPVTAAYHQSVWAKIGRSINPLIHRHAPFLKTPLSAVQRWWLR